VQSQSNESVGHVFRLVDTVEVTELVVIYLLRKKRPGLSDSTETLDTLEKITENILFPLSEKK